MKIIGAVVCYFRGHLRGREAGEDIVTGARPVTKIEGVPIYANHKVRVFACPRCGRETRYKVKPKSPAQSEPTDGSPHCSTYEGAEPSQAAPFWRTPA